MSQVSSSFLTPFFPSPCPLSYRSLRTYSFSYFTSSGPPAGSVIHTTADHIPLLYHFNHLLALPFPFYLLSFSTPHLPSPNLKPIQYLRCSNSAGENTPPCQQVPMCPLTAGLQSSLANHLCVPSEYSLPSLMKASQNHRETVHLSFAFPAAPPSYFLYVKGIPTKLG